MRHGDNYSSSEMMSFEYNVDENKNSRDNFRTVLRCATFLTATFSFADHVFQKQDSNEVWHLSLRGPPGNQPRSSEMSLASTTAVLHVTVLLRPACHD